MQLKDKWRNIRTKGYRALCDKFGPVDKHCHMAAVVPLTCDSSFELSIVLGCVFGVGGKRGGGVPCLCGVSF